MPLHTRSNSRSANISIRPESPPPTPHPHPMAHQSIHFQLSEAARQALSQRNSSRRNIILVALSIIACSAYLLISYPALAPRSLNAQVLRRPSSAIKAWTSHRKHKSAKKVYPQVTLDATQELAVVTSFLASLPQNVIPANVDPTSPIDPQVVLGFDTRGAHAVDEVNALVDDVWNRNPVVLYAKYFSPVTREIKATFKKLNMNPAPTIFDLDKRNDAQVLIPLLQRLLNSTALPILLINGTPLVPTSSANETASGDATAVSGSSSSSLFIEYFRELDKSGELKTMLKSAGVTMGGKRKKGRSL